MKLSLIPVAAFLGLAFVAATAKASTVPSSSNPGLAYTRTSLYSNLEANFRNPNEEAKPWTFWYWISGNVTREGITHDLEVMARAGIGGAYIFAIDRVDYEQFARLEKPVRGPSDDFWEMVKFATVEAKRLNLRLAINACDGWSLAGGPWITPELSMQRLTSSTIIVKDGNSASLTLPRPSTEPVGTPGPWHDERARDYYRDVAVLAYPVPHGWGEVAAENLKSGQLLAGFASKSGVHSARYSMDAVEEWTPDSAVPAQKRVPLGEVLDLTDKLDEKGNLNWQPPAGRDWLVQRFGAMSTGETIRPTSKYSRGLEVDKLNPNAVRVQFDNWYGEAVRRVGPELAGNVLTMNHSDSWECGSQNWSPVFREEFIRRRGYDPVKYLPATLGIPVGSAEESERFLWDFRRTIVDLVSESFFQTSVALTNSAGGIYSSETMAGTMTDSMEFYREVDVPMGEFWIASADQGAPIIPRVTSGAHIYGKRFIQTESFTERGIKWTEDPYFMKPLGDYSFTRGVNRFALHVWPLQAFPNKVPGVTLFNVYGTVFSGNQPWIEIGRPWFEYLRRCQAMLQQGLPVADVAYFIGEDLPADAIQRQNLDPALPFGYDYDCINRDALLTRATVKEGRLMLPDGVSYRMLVLPASSRMSPEVARKIGELATGGVFVIGAKPTRTYSLQGFPESDQELKNIVENSWKNVIQGRTPEEVLREKGVPKDVEFIGADMGWVHRGAKVAKSRANWTPSIGTATPHRVDVTMEYSSPTLSACHRRTHDADFYYLSNQELGARAVEAAFRITGKKPELWHPETGELRPLTDWRVSGGRTYIPLHFTEAESYFIVFRAVGDSPVNKRPNFTKSEKVSTIEGAWTVEFQSGRGAPESIKLANLASLSTHPDPGVRYFSGEATYRRRFTAPAAARKEAGEKILLDLGEVKNVAQITLNGRVLPGVWKPPYRVDITGALVSGENELVVRVGNTWKNRLLGDAALPPENRVTWTLFREKEGWFNPKKDQLEPSGLLGPVTLVREKIPE